MTISLAILVGTRPEAIKLAPVYLLLKKNSEFNVSLISTGQHRELLDSTLGEFGIKADVELNVMKANQSLTLLTSRLITAIEKELLYLKPDLVLVQGDTTTAFVGALVSFYLRISISHVEAGLRTNDKYEPFPEEINRRLITQLSDMHFTPNSRASETLLSEGISRESILMTGNSGIDALFMMKRNIEKDTTYWPASLPITLKDNGKLVLVTCHRRESFGAPLSRICSAIAKIAEIRQDVQFIFPVHPNPNIRETVNQHLKSVTNVILLPPISYKETVWLLLNSRLVITDSGGLQEEATTLGLKTLILREKTERQEAVIANMAFLVGSNEGKIVKNFLRLISENELSKKNQYFFGDGQASQRIENLLLDRYGNE
jgi:UDP-N-acetylglucosamine 2-epimerase (non-hydrolysing)